jgi:hypothetical protein
LQGVGRLAAHLRSFTVWVNEPLAEGVQSAMDSEDEP